MKRSLVRIIAFPFFVISLFGQSDPSIELTSAFPLNLFQSGPRDYFMTTKYSASAVLPSSEHADFLMTVSFTQQQSLVTQTGSPFDKIGALTEQIFVPFTSDSYYAEYGFFSGVRAKTDENTVQAFISGQLGVTGTKYGTIDEVSYVNHDVMPGGHQRRYESGTLMKIQLAALYGGGLMWHPVSGLRIVADLHAINRLTKQPLDVYRSIGIQFGL